MRQHYQWCAIHTKMLSIAKCLEILNSNQDPNKPAIKYTNENASFIRKELELLAQIELDYFKNYLDEKAGNPVFKSIN